MLICTYVPITHSPSSPPRIVGYDETLCEQPWEFPLTLKILVSVPPIIFILLALVFLHLYPITEQTREVTKRTLAARRCVFIHYVC